MKKLRMKTLSLIMAFAIIISIVPAVPIYAANDAFKAEIAKYTDVDGSMFSAVEAQLYYDEIRIGGTGEAEYVKVVIPYDDAFADENGDVAIPANVRCGYNYAFMGAYIDEDGEYSEADIEITQGSVSADYETIVLELTGFCDAILVFALPISIEDHIAVLAGRDPGDDISDIKTGRWSIQLFYGAEKVEKILNGETVDVTFDIPEELISDNYKVFGVNLVGDEAIVTNVQFDVDVDRENDRLTVRQSEFCDGIIIVGIPTYEMLEDIIRDVAGFPEPESIAHLKYIPYEIEMLYDEEEIAQILDGKFVKTAIETDPEMLPMAEYEFKVVGLNLFPIKPYEVERANVDIQIVPGTDSIEFGMGEFCDIVLLIAIPVAVDTTASSGTGTGTEESDDGSSKSTSSATTTSDDGSSKSTSSGTEESDDGSSKSTSSGTTTSSGITSSGTGTTSSGITSSGTGTTPTGTTSSGTGTTPTGTTSSGTTTTGTGGGAEECTNKVDGKNCDLPGCAFCGKGPGGIQLRALGDVDNDENHVISIFDALEVLKYLVRMEGNIIPDASRPTETDPASLQAAIISNNGLVADPPVPTIFCALEVLKKLVSMDSVVDGIHVHGTRWNQ